MTTPFSPSRTPRTTRTRYSDMDRPTPGNVGVEAGKRALKQSGREAKLGGAVKPQSKREPLGHPDFGQGQDQEQQQEPQDNRHLELLGQHFNMQGLGRDVPFFSWAVSNGAFRQFQQPGEVPFDIFEDAI